MNQHHQLDNAGTQDVTLLKIVQKRGLTDIDDTRGHQIIFKNE